MAETGFIVSSKRPSLDQLSKYPSNWVSMVKWVKPGAAYTDSNRRSEVQFSYPESDLAYRYWLVEETADSPKGFRATFDLAPTSFANSNEGFDLVDKNKWPYQLLEINGTNYRAYRMKNELHGKFVLNIRLKD